MEPFEAVHHLVPVILTGVPRGNWAAPQKIRWAAEHFPRTQILTVMAVDKRNHAMDGDILVDDQLKYAHLWEGASRIFMHHRSTTTTIAELERLIPEAMRPGPARSA
jgi:hypothetical protein